MKKNNKRVVPRRFRKTTENRRRQTGIATPPKSVFLSESVGNQRTAQVPHRFRKTAENRRSQTGISRAPENLCSFLNRWEINEPHRFPTDSERPPRIAEAKPGFQELPKSVFLSESVGSQRTAQVPHRFRKTAENRRSQTGIATPPKSVFLSESVGSQRQHRFPTDSERPPRIAEAKPGFKSPRKSVFLSESVGSQRTAQVPHRFRKTAENRRRQTGIATLPKSVFLSESVGNQRTAQVPHRFRKTAENRRRQSRIARAPENLCSFLNRWEINEPHRCPTDSGRPPRIAEGKAGLQLKNSIRRQLRHMTSAVAIPRRLSPVRRPRAMRSQSTSRLVRSSSDSASCTEQRS